MVFRADFEMLTKLTLAVFLQLLDKPVEVVPADWATQGGSPGWGNAGRGRRVRRAPRSFLGLC